MKAFVSKYRIFLIEIGLAVLILIVLGTVFKLRQPEVEYPGDHWTSSPMEAQGFDSAVMANSLLTLKEKEFPIHSLFVIRNGRSILDATFYPYDNRSVHDVASVTKSLMTTLIGIAIDQGKLELDQPMVSFFPERTIANLDERKERITVRHLLSMSSGLDCTAEGGERTQAEMVAAQDWIQFALDLPSIHEPGTLFDYCSPGMHLLSGILQEATGLSAAEFARLYLFVPLGIQDTYWPQDPQGYSHGWGDAALKPEDMARLGYLFLKNGSWEGKQIISKKWVNQATKMQSDAEGYSSEDYGFGWWISSPNDDVVYFAAEGRRGQRILVIPDWDMVLVTLGGGFEFSELEPYIVPSIKDLENALPTNPGGESQLQAAVEQISNTPDPQKITPLPVDISFVTGKSYHFNENPMQLESIKLDFPAPDMAIFTMDLGLEKEPRVTQVGLDGIYRNSLSGRPVIAKGGWQEDGSFVIDYNEGPGLSVYSIHLRFTGDQVEFDINIPGYAGHPVSGTIE